MPGGGGDGSTPPGGGAPGLGSSMALGGADERLAAPAGGGCARAPPSAVSYERLTERVAPAAQGGGRSTWQQAAGAEPTRAAHREQSSSVGSREAFVRHRGACRQRVGPGGDGAAAAVSSTPGCARAKAPGSWGGEPACPEG